MKSFRSRVTWYVARLSSMSAPEITHRLNEAIKKESARRFTGGWRAFSVSGPLHTCAAIATLRGVDPHVAAIIATEATAVRSGSFALLGARWPELSGMPPPRDFWHLDPTDGQPWPSQSYCFDVAFRHGIETREIKRVWEINRLQFLIPLAADAAMQNSQVGRQLIDGVVKSWMAGNAPFRGVNWISPIELALRVISVAVSLSITGTQHLDEASREQLLSFFAAHAFWIARFPSLYSSANNHRVAELAGLVVATTIAPGIANAKRLGEESWAALLSELERQILPDGCGAEQAPNYSAFMIELALVSALFARERNLTFSSVACERLARWADHVRWLMNDDGQVPAIGDCDDCRVVTMTQAAEPRYVGSIAAAVAGVLNKASLVPTARDRHLRDYFFGSPEDSVYMSSGIRTFDCGGLSVARLTRPPNWNLIFDHGPVGYLSIAAHGHADALALWLSIGGRQVIVDAGTYLYLSDRAWRDRFRSTAVHNTLSIGDTSSSRPSGPFNWARKAKVRLIAAASEPYPRFAAEHDGYLDRFGCWHRRIVEIPNPSSVVVTDKLIGREVREPVSLSFLLDPSFNVVGDGEKAVHVKDGDESILYLESLGPLSARVVRGDETEKLGWISKSFGSREPTSQILFEGVLGKSVSIVRLTLL